jgi:hypothetical protein
MDKCEAAHVAALASAGYYNVYNGISHADLTSSAFKRLARLLEDYGNTLSQPHREALFALTCMITEMAQHRIAGRWAYGLPTGMGKTTAIIAWIATLATLGANHISVAVSASKVEALCDLKRHIIAQGVPPELIGLVHSKRYDPAKRDAVMRGESIAEEYASEPSEGEDRQIMLVTHQRVRGCSLDSFNLYRGKPRDLLLYDESLIVSDSLGIQFTLFKSAIAWLAARHESSEKHRPMIDYLEQCRDLITADLDRQKDGGTGVNTITLPSVPPGTVEEFKSLLGRHPVVDPVLELFDIADQSIRVIATGQGGIVHYALSVPREIKNIIVLDASQPIRRLVHLDATIKDAEKHHPKIRNLGVALSKIKRFDRVILHQMFAAGGRETMREDFSRDRAEDRRVSREVISVVKEVPATEAVLIFTYKARPTEKVAYRDILLADMKAAGIDTDATVTVNGQPRPRISVLTWGMETSLNSYAHCSHVILAGVMQRSPIDLAASFVGQKDDLTADVPAKVIRDLQTSESAHLIYQALSRGCCREVTNGMARPMTGWIIHRDGTVQKELETVMPGANWRIWEPQYGKPSGGTIRTLAAKIADHLRQLPEQVDRISSRTLKEDMNAKDVPSQTWKHALATYLDNGTEWLLQGRSLIRAASLFAD